MTGTGRVLLAWSLLALGVSARGGEFSLYGLAFVTVGLGLVASVVLARLPLHVPQRPDLVLPVAVSVLSAVAHPARRNMHIGSAGGLLATAVLSCVVAALTGLSLRLPDSHQRRCWPGLAVLAGGTGVVTVLLSPDPYIDVWHLLQESSDGLLRGADLYRQHWSQRHGLRDVYPYLPGTTVLLAPFRWLLGDVRYGLLAAILGGAWVIRRLAPRAPVALAALLLVFPHWVLLVDQSWTEPLLLLALAGAVLALRQERPGLAVLGLAVALACKQHVVLLLPVFALWPTFGPRRAAWSALLAGLVVLPWLVAGPGDLWHDAVSANLSLGVLRRALSLPSLFGRAGVVVGFWFTLLALGAAYALVLRRVRRTPSGLALGCGVVMWALDVANKQSFFNHYTLPLGLLVVALAAAEPDSDPLADQGAVTMTTGEGVVTTP